MVLMPIYEFKCSKCDLVFEKLFLTPSAQNVTCPACGSKEIEKEYSVFSNGCDNHTSNMSKNSGGHSGMG
jgi:putative FmdB family regulatory protein